MGIAVIAPPLTARATMVDDSGRSYRLVRRLGEGGFGAVWLAEVTTQAGLRSQVAVKLLRPDVDARNQAVERLRDEAMVLASLHHPVILAAHDLVVLNGQIALVTEYVEGQDLGECISDPVDPIPIGALVDVIGQVASALDAAWTQLGIVHRDVKPANVRIGRHGNVKLLDFGIAKSDLLSRAAHTQVDIVMGSTAYLAPERFDLDRLPHPASDVFALGCVLYEGLSRVKMYQRMDTAQVIDLAESPEEYAAHIERRLATPMHEGIRALLRRMFVYDPDERIALAEVARLCDTLVTELPDRLTLRIWCRARKWPDPEGTTRGVELRPALEARVPPPAPPAPPVPQADFPGERFLEEEPTVHKPRQAPSAPPARPRVAAPPLPETQPPAPRPEETTHPGQGSAAHASQGSQGALAPEPVSGGTLYDKPRRWLGFAALGGVLGATGLSVLALLLGSSTLVILALFLLPGGGHRAAPPAFPTQGPPLQLPDESALRATEPEPEPQREVILPRTSTRPVPVPTPDPVVSDPLDAVDEQEDPPERPAEQPPTERSSNKASEGASALVTTAEALPIELRGVNGTFSPGPVPPGAYSVFANFGRGWVRAGSVQLEADAQVDIDCNAIKAVCIGR